MRKITRNRALTLLCAALTITLTTLAGFSLERTAKASVFETVFTAVSNAGAIITGTSPAPSKDTKKPAPLGSNPERIMFSEQAYENGRWVDKIRSIDPALAPQTPSDLGSVEDFEPAIAPSGNSIVFSSLRDAPPEGTDHDRNRYRRLYSMNADGSDQVRQPTGNFIGAETSPSISPDGTTVVYVADYSYGGQPQGIYTSLLQPPFTTTELISDTSSCGVPVAKRTPRRENAGDLYIGYNNPNFTPDGLSVIFGYDSDNFGMAIYKVEVSTGNCTKLADTGSYANPNAVISPDGTQIAFYYEELMIAGDQLGSGIREIRVIDAQNGSQIQTLNATDVSGSLAWSPDGSKIAYLAGGYDPNNGQFLPNQYIRTIDVSSSQIDELYMTGVVDGLGGITWGSGPNTTPAGSMRIETNPVVGGFSTNAIVTIPSPAPAGGYTFNVGYTGQVGIIGVPSTATIPEGQTSVAIPITTQIRSDHGRTADVHANTSGSPWIYTSATVSLRKTQPDLRAVTFNAPANTAPDVTMNFDWTVENIGLAATGANGGVDSVYFSLDQYPSYDDQWVTSLSNGALAAGASRTLSSTGSILPSSVPGPGDYYLIFTTNKDRSVVEGGEYQNNTIVRPIHVDLPDLVPENFSVPATVEPAVNYPVSWTVRNAGTVPVAATSYSQLYFSMDNVEGGADDVYIGTVTTAPLAAGASVVQSATARIPSTPERPTQGAFFYVVVDYSQNVNEGTPASPGEMNNTLFAGTQFEYRVPDLTSTASGVPAEAETDTSFPVSWTTANIGNKAAGNFNEQVYFSLDNQVGSDHLLGTFPLTGGLAAGASVDRIQNVSINTNWIAASGNYYLYIKTDSSNAADEGVHESNNIRFQPINVRRLLRPDLVVTNITAPTTSLFGQMVTVQWTVTNQGQGPTNAVTWRDRVNLNTTGSNSSGSKVAEIDNATALSPGQSYTTSATFEIPRGYVGSYQFVVTADINSSLNDENPANNKTTKPITINVPPLPNLSVENVQAPAEGYAGQPFEVHWTGRNIGNADAQDEIRIRENKPWSWSDAVYLSRDTTLDGSDIRIQTTLGRATPLAPNATYTRNTWVDEPYETPDHYVRLPNNVEGQYYVLVETDSTDRIYEYTFEGNNVGYDPTPVNIINTPADLAITDVMIAPASGNAAATYEMSFVARNIGAFATSVGWTDGIYLSNDATWSTDDVLVFSKGNSSMAGQTSKTVTGQVTIPYCFEGTKYLIPKMDIADRQPEFDPGHDAEANNAGPAKAISLTSLPMDLTASNLTVSPAPQPGSVVTVSWTDTNNGTGPTPGVFWDRVSLIRPDGTNVATLIRPRIDVPLAPSASAVRSFAIGLPSYMQGTYKIRVGVNDSGHISECAPNQDNNILDSAEFTVSNNLPDLTPQNVSPTAANYTAGDPLTVNFDETNLGQSSAIGQNGWMTYAYLSSDTTLWHNDLFLGQAISTDPLAPGATRSLSISGAIGNVPAGTYYVLIYTDGENKVNEGPGSSTFELNNVQASGSITVTLPSIDLTAAVNSVTTPTYTGQTVAVNYTITNLGTQATLTNQWRDEVFLSRDGVLDVTDQRIGWKNQTAGLAGGANYSDTIYATIPTGLTGLYRIFIKTDAGDAVVEANNSNNLSAPLDANIELPPPADLSITNITPTANIAPGGGISMAFTTQNSGVNSAYGKWRTTFYLSTDQFWSADDYLLGAQERDGAPLAPGATEVLNAGFTVPMVGEGIYYVIGRVDSQNRIPESDEANNTAASGTQTTAAIETLTLGTPSNWSFTGSGQRLFKFLPPVDETVLVTLDGEQGSWNRLLTRADAPASLAEYDFTDDGARSADKDNAIPNTTTNQYYSLVKTDFIPAEFQPLQKGSSGNAWNPGTQDLSIKAEVIGFGIRTVTPSTVGNNGAATLRILGAKFKQGAVIELVGQGGSVVIPAKLSAVTGTDIRALFELTGRPAGVYDVRVTNPGNEVTVKSSAVTIVSGGGHQLRVEMGGPRSVRNVQSRARYTVSVVNDGLNDAQGVPLLFSVPSYVNYTIDQANYFEWPQEMLPDGMTTADVPPHFEKDGRKLIFLYIPIVQGRSQVSVSLSLQFPMNTGLDILYGIGVPFADLVSGAQDVLDSTGRLILRDGRSGSLRTNYDEEWAKCMAEFTRALIFFILNEIGPQSCVSAAKAFIGGIVDFATGIALGKATGQASEASVATGGIGMWLGMMKNAALCAGKSVPVLKAVSLAWGIGNLLNQLLDCLQHLYRWTVGVAFTLDPNEKIGPLGYGPEKFVGIQRPLEYRINFENVAEATAPVQKIRIVDALPPGVDPRTVRLKEVGFHHYSYVVPDGPPVFQAVEQLGADLNNLKVNISAGLDIVNRQVAWTMTAVDPQTGERPLDPMLGILPPNNSNHDGDGYVIFTIEADPASVNRTDIANKASIYFDENEVIETNVTSNLIDSTVPTSSLTLDGTTNGETPSIGFTWTGTDDSDGSGFALCSIFASENNGAFMPTGEFTTLTGTGGFMGHWGKRYDLYSICKDNAGNTEAPPLTPDASIQVRGGDTESDVGPRPDGSNGVVDAADLDQVRRFVGRLDQSSTMQYNEFQRADSAPKATGGDGALTVADIMQARRFASALDPRAEAAGPNAAVPFAPKFADGMRADLLDPRGLSIVRAYRGMNKLRVAIELSAQGDETATGFSLNFDPAVLSAPIVTAGDDATGGVLTVNSDQAATGKLGVILDKAPTDVFAAGYRFIVLVEFTVVGAPPATTTISFGNDPVSMETVNGAAGSLAATYSPATIDLLSPTAAPVSIDGRVIDARGLPVRNAVVQLSQATGGRVRSLTNAFGYFRFDNVASGSTYVIATTARGLTFRPRVLNVNDPITGLEIQAEP